MPEPESAPPGSAEQLLKASTVDPPVVALHSLEAPTRRAEKGLPRVNALTEADKAIPVLHQIPLGGEDCDRYQGPARLIRATGEEPFGTLADGEPVVEHAEPGEVVRCDSAGVTCRRWSWRQGCRPALTDDTPSALLILDALSPISDEQPTLAGEAIAEALSLMGEEVTVTTRLVGA